MLDHHMQDRLQRRLDIAIRRERGHSDVPF